MEKVRVSIPGLLSAAAVIASLVFLGFEIRQNTVAQRAETRQALADASREFILTIASDRELSRVWHAMWRPELDGGRAGPHLSPADTLQAKAAMHANLRNLENVYLQAMEGVVDADVLGSYGWAGPLYASPGFWAFWEARKPAYDSRFVLAFEESHQR